MNEFETGVCVGYLLNKGKAIALDTFSTSANGHWTAAAGHAWDEITVAVPLTSITITQNGHTTAASGGYNDITVNVPTYEEEYEEMLECQQHVVAALKKWWGNSFDPQDCNDIVEAVDNIDKPVEEDKTDGLPDDDAQKTTNPDEPTTPEPTADNSDKLYEFVSGEITRKVTWYWITPIHHNSTMYPLYSRDFAVDVTTYNGTSTQTIHYEYNVGWVTGSDLPTMADFVDQNDWSVEYLNENTGTAYSTASGGRLHIHYISRTGYPGYTDQTIDLYF